MKNILALSILALSLNSFASATEGTVVVVPYPTQHGAYFGGIKRVEGEVLADLKAKVLAVCKTKENIAAIANVEVKVSFDLIMEDSDEFEGGYPLASATAEVFCHNKL
jgi:hypothetical protein